MPNAIQLANGPLPQAANTTLTASIPSSGAATPTVASAANLPTKGPFLLVVDNERIEVDSISGSTLTILSGGRAKEGTSAAAHSSGASVYQVLSALTAVRLVEDRTGTVLAPDPTGVAATDKANLDALTSTANRVVQLRPGTYVVNPLATLAAGVVLRGWPNLATTLKLAVQASTLMTTLGTGGGLEGLILDGDRASQSHAGEEYEFLVGLATRTRVTGCRIQNVKSTVLGCFGSSEQLEVPQITACTTSTTGGSLATGILHWYRVTATTASGETSPSAEASVTTGAGSTNSNTVRWCRITGATGYKVYHSTLLAGQWSELLLTTIGSGSTLVYVHTTGAGATTSPPMTNTSGGAGMEAIEITGNTFTNLGKTGIYTQTNIRNSHFSRNQFSLVTRNCVKISGSSAPAGSGYSTDNKVQDNVCDYSGVTVGAETALAIELWSNVPNTIISGNHVFGPADSSTGQFLGISVGGNSDNTVVANNIVRKAHPAGRNDIIYAGIENVGNTGVVISANIVVGCVLGISVGRPDFSAGGADNSSVIGNRVMECADFGIQVSEGSGHTISGNTFIDAGYRYIFLNGFEKQTLANAVVGNICFIASNNRSSHPFAGGRMDAIYIVESGRQTITGNICGPMPPINTPATPTVTPQGTTGATTYSYKVTAVNEYGETVGSATGSTATGNATLTGANFNRVTFTRINSATGYRVYRTAGPGGAGYLGKTVEQYGGTPTFDDTGIAADTTLTAPATGTTGGTSTVGLTGMYFQGTVLLEASVISGNRWDGAAPSGSAQPIYTIHLDGPVDSTQITNNFATNYSSGFIRQLGTLGTNPNYVQFNVTPGVPLPHMGTSKFQDIVRRADEVQRLGGGAYLADDFTGGLTTTGNIGDLGWSFLNGAFSNPGSIPGHPGMVRLSSTTTSGTRMYFWVSSSATGGQVAAVDWWHIIILLRINTGADANTIIRAGLGNSVNADPPADGCYIEKLAADTSWFGVNRASAAQGRTAALRTVTEGTNEWMKLCVRRYSATQTGFSVSNSFAPDNGTEALLSGNIAAGLTAFVPYVMIGNTAAASKNLDIDYVELNVNNMSR